MNIPDNEKFVLSRSGNWTFDHHVSKIFDAHVRKSIPCYEDIQDIIGRISKRLLNNKDRVCDLGTATGQVIQSIYNTNREKQIQFTGIDESHPMLEEAKFKCNLIPHTRFLNEKIENHQFDSYELITSVFTLQFIDPPLRQSILKKIADSLQPKGYFIFCEKVNYCQECSNTFFISVHEDWKSNHFTAEEISSKRKSLKNVMRLFTLEKYIELLKNARFNQIEIFFRWCNFVCLLAH
ncbi:methyltransferase domain-containing protein [Carboxylicivirga marina]|uniref:methyltransferase domain-containing protein n=1 Tax=Carboxylicivirga marina TaxID=2800988 RepID=UPI0025949F06|nr:methyltransferase domain-containing protein [uncultured Carboxylicivirga sp.]